MMLVCKNVARYVVARQALLRHRQKITVAALPFPVAAARHIHTVLSSPPSLQVVRHGPHCPGYSLQRQRYAGAAAGGNNEAAGGSDDDEAGEGSDEDEDGFFTSDFEDDDDQDGPEVGPGLADTAGTDWGEAALASVQRVLSDYDTLTLYSFRAIKSSKRLDIRLDKLTNQFGSPSLEEVGEVCRKLNTDLEAALGEEAAGEIEVEVSSAGAERAIKVPEELTRFAELPMKVEYESLETSDGKATTQVLAFVEAREREEAGSSSLMTMWRLADVRANRSGKGRPLNKKQRETVIEIKAAAIKKVNLHVDI